MSDEAELYTVLEVENVGPAMYDYTRSGTIYELGPGWSYYHARYRNPQFLYLRTVVARDELEAYTKAQKELNRLKSRAIRRKARRKEACPTKR